MNTTVSVSAAILIAASFLSGCSKDFMPLSSDYFVAVSVSAGNTAFRLDGDGEPLFASIDMCMSQSNKGCGRRAVADGFDDDEFVVEISDVGTGEIFCHDTGAPDPEGFVLARCGAYVKEAPPGREALFTFNDLAACKVTMPPYLTLTTPAAGAVFSMADGKGITITWDPTNSGDELTWQWKRATDEAACTGILGEGDTLADTGSFVIPPELLPASSDLPPQGCPVELTTIRTHEGTMASGITGVFTGTQRRDIVVTFKP